MIILPGGRDPAAFTLTKFASTRNIKKTFNNSVILTFMNVQCQKFLSFLLSVVYSQRNESKERTVTPTVLASKVSVVNEMSISP